MTLPTFAVQPNNWGCFDEAGADYAINISHAYEICRQWRLGGEDGDMMIWRLTTGEPLRWVRVYADESVDVATLSEQELDLLTIDKY